MITIGTQRRKNKHDETERKNIDTDICSPGWSPRAFSLSTHKSRSWIVSTTMLILMYILFFSLASTRELIYLRATSPECRRCARIREPNDVFRFLCLSTRIMRLSIGWDNSLMDTRFWHVNQSGMITTDVEQRARSIFILPTAAVGVQLEGKGIVQR